MAAPDFRRTLRTQLRRLNNAPPQDNLDGGGGGGCVIEFSPANLNNNSSSNNNNNTPPTLAVHRPEALKLRSKSSSRHTSNDCDEELAGIICNGMAKNSKAKRRGSLFFLGTDEEDDESRESSPTQMSVDSGNGASLKSASVSPIPPRSNSNTSSTSATLALKQNQQRKKLTAGLFQNAPTSNSSSLSSTPPKMTSNSSSSQLDRMRSYNRNMRRAKSFRGSMRERSLSGSGRYIRKEAKIDNQVDVKKVAAFKVSRSKFGRKGWKVMPEEDNLDLKESAGAIEKVMARIKDLEFSGKDVPDTITVEWG